MSEPPASRATAPRPSRSAVHARRGMVATSQPLASQAGLELLARGGSAVDAAIGANAVLCVVEPTGCGVGGDLMAIVAGPGARPPVGFNGSGRSPRGLSRRHFEERGLDAVPARGALSVSVPGCVDGWCELHARFGRLPLDEVLAPAVEHAREGFPVSPVIAGEWARGLAALRSFPAFVEQFAPGGEAPRTGQVVRRPGLARVLELVAAHGRDGFYRGEVARGVARAVAEGGGLLDEHDLAAHAGEWVAPLSVRYRDLLVHELPGNTQGPTALEMLGLLERFDVGALDFLGADHVHLFTEVKKLAFADRARFLGDPAHPSTGAGEADGAALLEPAFLDGRAERVRLDRAAVEVPSGAPRVARGDTVTLAAGDADGLLVSLIQSNFRGFGSGVAPVGLGFVLQNRGELFDLSLGAGANRYAPGKRPFHTIIPGLAERGGEPWLAFGVMGGDTQPQAHAQVLAALVDFGLDVQAAGDAPRFVHLGDAHPTATPAAGTREGLGELAVEEGIAPAVRAELRRRGHRVTVGGGHFGGYQAVAREAGTGVYSGGSDARKDGCAAGR